MNLNNFTIKAQEAVQQAVQLATQNGQQAIEAVHLLKGVIMTGESVTNFIFQKLGVNIQNLNRVLDAQISSLPKVSGGEPYLSSEYCFAESNRLFIQNGRPVCVFGADYFGLVHGKEHCFSNSERCRYDGE